MNLYPAIRPALRCLDPERAHQLTLAALRLGLGPGRERAPDPALAQELWGMRFPSPLGLAAGFDKNGVAIGPLLEMGFGFVEIGTVTPRPQPGNPRPRIFRLTEDEAVINRLGFNNAGADAALRRLGAFRSGPGRMREGGLVGVNIGRNKDSADAAADYAQCAETLGPLADYMVINVSSPNTPGLRDLQARAELEELLSAVRDALARAEAWPPVLVKIAPDMADETLADIAALARDGAMAGLIVSNTTISRPEGLKSRHREQAGGLSGRPLFAPSTRLLADCYRETDGRVPLIGIGGIFTAEDAWAKLSAGASLISLYTGLVYKGPGLVSEILSGLADRMRAGGFATLADVIGHEARGPGA